MAAPLLTLEAASLAYGHVPLLDHVDLQIDAGERVALIGVNGAGKTSLLKAVAGLAHLDDGRTWQRPGLKLAYVPQEPALPASGSVREAVAEGLGAMAHSIAEYGATTAALASGHGSMNEHDVLMERLAVLQAELDHGNGWAAANQVEAVLSRFSLDGDAVVTTLSGGLRKRVALARALVTEPDLLILDEPTNHLDIAVIEWLENFLAERNGGLLLVTHDRRFLDCVATRIVELDRGILRSFPGNFAAYQAKKIEMLAVEAVHQQKFDKVLAQEEVWIRQGVQARRTRNEGRVRRLESLRLVRQARREQSGRVQFSLAEGERSGKLVAELEGVTKSFGAKAVVKDFSARILRGDRIGLIGPNGAGKTTLLKLMLGELKPDSGKVRLGTKIEIAYFDQLRAQLDEEATLTDTISKGSDFIEIAGVRKHVISYLGDFLFAPARARSPVKSLSGGERNRLLLARLFSRPANVLVLDEPTNDLDIDTLDLLESLLQDYPGTVLLVSHDRAFLDNVVTQVIAAEGDGCWRENFGGYGDWQAFKAREQLAEKNTTSHEKQKTATPGVVNTERPKAKLSFKEARELEMLPGKIEAFEVEQAAIAVELANPKLYQEAHDRALALQARTAELEKLLGTAMERWTELEMR